MRNGGAGRGGVGSVVVVELNSQTDFVARNSLFQGLLYEIMKAAQAQVLGQAATVGPDHSLNLDEVSIPWRLQIRLQRSKLYAATIETITLVVVNAETGVHLSNRTGRSLSCRLRL